MGFFTSYIECLLAQGHQVDIATNEADRKTPDCYREWGCAVYQVDTSRSPLDRKNLKAIRQIKKLVTQQNYDIVHCHTPVAAMCTRIACRKVRKNGTKVFYTAHGFHFYKRAPLKNWLLYYPVEKVCSYFTDVLITINREDYALAQRKMKAGRVEYVPGVGIDSCYFCNVQVDKSTKRQELGVPENALLLVSAGELNRNKNQEVVIRALAEIGDRNVYYVIAGRGSNEPNLQDLIARLNLHEQVKLVGYRSDIAQLYHAADVCVLSSIREGLGLAAIEGMACGLPLIIADNRGTRDFCENGVNALVCKYDSAAEFASAIKKMRDEPNIRQVFGERNRQLSEKFDVAHINEKMKKIYGLSQEVTCEQLL